jgi:hypothetical protein
VTLGTRSGRRLAEINPVLNVISWRRNGVSKMPIQMARDDVHLTRDNFNPGNRLLVEFDNGLPAWGGIVDPPSRWTLDNYRTTVCSAEQLLLTRQTDRGRYFTEATPSYIFGSVLTEAENFAGTVVEIGSLEDAGAVYSPEYHLESLLGVAESLVSLTGVDFWLEPRLIAGEIRFLVYMKPRRGSVKPKVVLQEGLNIAEITLDEQGPIINHWVTAGSGSGWGDDRIYSEARDEASVSRYGLRQGTGIYSDIVLNATLDIKTQALLEASSKPGNRWSVEVQNVKPALFASYDVGDSVRLVAPSFGWDGFDGFVRVDARYFDPTTEECVLIVEEDRSL